MFVIYMLPLIASEKLDIYFRIPAYIFRFLFPIIIIGILIFHRHKPISILTPNIQVILEIITVISIGISLLFNTISSGGSFIVKTMYFLIFSSMSSIRFSYRLVIFGIYYIFDV